VQFTLDCVCTVLLLLLPLQEADGPWVSDTLVDDERYLAASVKGKPAWLTQHHQHAFVTLFSAAASCHASDC
jgi:hypothetical protein